MEITMTVLRRSNIACENLLRLMLSDFFHVTAHATVNPLKRIGGMSVKKQRVTAVKR